MYRFALAGLAMLFGVTGCVSVSKHLVSEPTIEAKGLEITKSGWLKVGDVIFAVRPYNAITIGWSNGFLFGSTEVRELSRNEFRYDTMYYDGKLANKTEFFIVEFLVAPHSKHGLIDFQRFVLKTSANRLVVPSHYYDLEPRYGSSAPWFDPFDQIGMYLCKPKQQPNWSAVSPLKAAVGIDTNQKVELQKDHEYCFALKYDVPPPFPTTAFSIELNGIVLNDEVVSLPIRYVPVTRSYRHSNPVQF